LPDGKVLIAGGSLDGRKSAELYDPATGTFTATGDMTTSGGTATLLSNGEVLITNGSVDASAELYDPSTGAFRRTGNPTTRGAHIATLLPNGKVLIVPSDEGADLSAELYDPGTGTFSRTDWRNIDIMVAATVNVLASGNVLVTLNQQDGDSGSHAAERFDSSSGAFPAPGDMTYGICRPTGPLPPDGTVLVANGWFTLSGNAQLYDPGSGKFSPTGDMIASRHDHTSTLLKDGTVLIAGGYGNVPNLLTSSPPLLTGAELYNPVSLRPPPMILSRLLVAI